MSYRDTRTTERRAGQVRFYNGATRVGVVFFDGKTLAFPAEPFRKVGLVVGDAFVMLVTREGKKVISVVIKPLPPPRVPVDAQVARKVQPKMYDRVGRGLVTRKNPVPCGCTVPCTCATVPPGRPGRRL